MSPLRNLALTTSSEQLLLFSTKDESAFPSQVNGSEVFLSEAAKATWFA